MVFKKGHLGYWKGKSRSNNTKMKVGTFFKGKTYEEIMGKEKAQIRKQQQYGYKFLDKQEVIIKYV